MWDANIFAVDVNEDFLSELNELDEEDIVESVRDACLLVQRQDHVTEEERLNGLAAATIAAVWAGAPFSGGQIAEDYPFLRELVGAGDDVLNEAAAELLEGVEAEDDLEQFIEALQ